VSPEGDKDILILGMMNGNSTVDGSEWTDYRDDFPLLRRVIHGKPVIYLDSAATALKPRVVIDEVVKYYSEYNANVHRAVHLLSEEATEAFEAARETVARFVGAEAREIAFVRHATEALNIVARSLPEGARVAVADAEHHSNLLPWRCHEVLRLEIGADGAVDLARAAAAIREARPSLLTLSLIGNALGTRQPVEELTALAHEVGASVMLDVSQAVGHEPLNVRTLDCDFLCFSGHKMMGPGGVGVLYVRSGLEDSLQPLLRGGSMVLNVGLEDCELQPFPWCFEAGTPNVEGVLGLAAACRYLDGIGLDRIDAHNRGLSCLLRQGLRQIPRVTIHGAADDECSAITSFSVSGQQAHGVARLLSNRHAMMLRSGYHCAQPLHLVLQLPETVRVSVHLYNTADEIRKCVAAVEVASKMP